MLTLSLEPDLGIEHCAGLKQMLSQCLHQSDPVLLDGGATNRVHAASLQVLCALFRSREHAGLETHWVHVSPILGEAARLLGLSTVLALPAHQSPSSPHHTQNQDMEIAA